MLKKRSRTTKTGTDYRPDDSLLEYNTLIKSIQQHHSHCTELISHLSSSCPHTRSLYSISPIASPKDRLDHFQLISDQIQNYITNNSPQVNVESCSILILQKNMLEIVLEISTKLNELIETEMKQKHNSEYDVYYNDAINFHNRILSEVLQASSMFMGKGHFSQLGFSSSTLNNAISHIAATTLQLSRHLLSRPIILHEKLSISSLFESSSSSSHNKG